MTLTRPPAVLRDVALVCDLDGAGYHRPRQQSSRRHLARRLLPIPGSFLPACSALLPEARAIPTGPRHKAGQRARCRVLGHRAQSGQVAFEVLFSETWQEGSRLGLAQVPRDSLSFRLALRRPEQGASLAFAARLPARASCLRTLNTC